ncbi:MAG: DNA alkylation repair protein [Verrucomicrobia subdivision 3 bacterium]|nr:DNA alkylation repair protein [Limisphaerales bacterium]
MTTAEVMRALETLGSAQTKKTYLRHGCPEPFFGVKIADMKALIRKFKIQDDTALARELYRTGNSDAMYLAGMICDGGKLTRRELDDWARQATWHMISESTVPALAVEHPEGWQAALKWIDSPQEKVSLAGWTTAAGIAAVRDDKDLDLKTLETLLDRVEKTIHQAPNYTRSAMNGFVIAMGSYVKPLAAKAQAVAETIGEVKVDMGDTACKVPLASAYIKKVIAKGRQGMKRRQ